MCGCAGVGLAVRESGRDWERVCVREAESERHSWKR